MNITLKYKLIVATSLILIFTYITSNIVVTNNIFDNINYIRFLLLVILLFGLIINFLIISYVSSKILKSVNTLIDTLQNIISKNLKSNITVSSSDNLDIITNAIVLFSEEIESKMNMLSFEKSKLNSILDSMGEGVIALNSNNEVIAVNHVAQSFVDNELMNEIINLSLRVRSLKTRTIFELNHKNKNFLLCATSLQAPRVENGVVIIFTNVTELRLLQEKQKQFVTNVSHELRTPLTTILGYIDLLKNKGTDKNIFETCIKHLESSSDRLLRLINDLLDLSTLAKYEFEVQPKNTNLTELLTEISNQMSIKAKKFEITIKNELDNIPNVMLDPTRIKQVFVNLIDNAIKYSKGSEIKIKLFHSHPYVFVIISDNGMGIPKESLSKIFEPFYRVDKNRARNIGGNGLGLSISKEIIENHNGSIEIINNNGTQVHIKLPME